MFFDDRYSERDWREYSETYDRAERQRKARDMADWHAGDSPELISFIDQTTPDAPGGRCVMQPESDLDQATRRGPDFQITGQNRLKEVA